MFVDLHCHSTHSDGSESARAVAERAAARGVELFALTDHDTAAGWDAVSAVFGPRARRAVELSCSFEGRSVHLLVYDVGGGPAWTRLEAFLKGAASARRDRARDIAAKLAALGAPIDVEAAIAGAGGALGRPHLARALVAAGHVRTTADAFARYLSDGGPAHIPFVPLDVGAALEMLEGGAQRLALAHPHTLGDDARLLLSRYRDAGLGGLEAYYGRYSARERRTWLELAGRYDLVVTAGSDFHGRDLPAVLRPGLEVPEPHAARLRDWLAL